MKELKVKKIGDVYVLKIDGKLDLQHADDIKTVVMQLLSKKYLYFWESRN